LTAENAKNGYAFIYENGQKFPLSQLAKEVRNKDKIKGGNYVSKM